MGMRQLVRSLDKSEVDQAYALVRLAVPSLDAASWRAFARSMLTRKGAERGGILVAVENGPSFTGMLVYYLGHDLRCGPLMIVDPLVPVGFSKRHAGALTQALLAGAEAIARRLGCSTLRVTIEERRLISVDGERADALGELGFVPEMLTLYERRLT
jgi:hypothetical protein